MSTFNIGAVSGSGNVFGDNARIRREATGGDGRADGAAGSPDPSSSRSGSGARPARDAAAEDTRRLGEGEIVELARLYPSALRATTLLRRAGFRVEQLPVFEASANPREYWTQVSQQLGHGVAARGRQRLLAVALSDYPHNPVFGGR